MLIDFGTAKSLNNHFYPPGIIQIYHVVMRLFHDPATPPASVVGIVRLMAITTSLGVVVVIGLFGYHAVGKSAGLARRCNLEHYATLCGADHPLGDGGNLGILLHPALYGTTVAILYRRESWSTFATYALMLAIVFKYLRILGTACFWRLCGVGCPEKGCSATWVALPSAFGCFSSPQHSKFSTRLRNHMQVPG